MAKAKRSRRTSIRHMSADDPGVLEALERAEQQGAPAEAPSEPEDEESETED
ncbi:MAG TPA: hypothetical protein VKD47_07335 [Miltoncostaeaceae bacterium]|nr:hypothetical protein [Miltoncostaeaceae bacterium]